jgi:hypothetical protein
VPAVFSPPPAVRGAAHLFRRPPASTAAPSSALRHDGAGRARRVFLYDRDRYMHNDLTRRAVGIIFTASRAGAVVRITEYPERGLHAGVRGRADIGADGCEQNSHRARRMQAYVSLNVALKKGVLQRPITDQDNALQRSGFPVKRLPGRHNH